VQRYGVSIFDENAHGFRPSQAVVAYLAASPARSVFGGLCLLGLLVFWRGSFVPGKALVVSEPPAPALDAYVDSLAGWYARTTDYAGVAERYRQYALTRLRRQLGLSAEVTPEAVLDRLRSTLHSTGLNRASLLRPPMARSRDELFAVADEIDATIHAALQGGATGSTARVNPARIEEI